MDKYIGFYIDKPIGNNIFSYEDRENKKIYVLFCHPKERNFR